MKTYIGIDPGSKGAICFITNGDAVFIDWDNREFIRNELEHMDIAGACLEKVSAMPGQGVASMFKFGANFGWWQGLLEAMHVPYKLVRPQEWQKGFSFPKDKKERKQAIAIAGKRLYPEATLKTERGALMDGRSDALLIAHYAIKEFA